MSLHILRHTLFSPLYGIYADVLAREICTGPLPKHIAVILDGNRRYARDFGLKHPFLGHEIGTNKVTEFLIWCLDLGLKNVTLFAFSTENFKRPKEEVDALMDLVEKKFYELAEDEIVHDNRVKVRGIGRLNMLPARVVEAIRTAEEATATYDNHFLNVAIAYGGKAELVDAIRGIMDKVKSGEIKPDDITETTINEHLYATDMPPVDLIIRTSGERRISNFLLWQSKDSQLCFLDVYWPAIRRIDLLRAVRTYQHREGSRSGLIQRNANVN